MKRLGRAVGNHPGRSGLIAAVLALVLIAALLTAERDDVPDARGGLGQAVGGAGTSGPQAGGGGDGTVAPSDPTVDTGPAAGGGAGAGRQGEATPVTPPSNAPSGATRPGPGGGATGAEPVAPRPPVRCAPGGPPKAAPLPPADEQGERRWVTVGRLAGSCDAASPTFQLLGIDTRLVWRSDAESFAVFVVDAALGRDATAGFADGQCAGSCSERQPIVPAAGSYLLEVQAGDAPWEVEIQEYRRP